MMQLLLNQKEFFLVKPYIFLKYFFLCIATCGKPTFCAKSSQKTLKWWGKRGLVCSTTHKLCNSFSSRISFIYFSNRLLPPSLMKRRIWLIAGFQVKSCHFSPIQTSLLVKVSLFVSDTTKKTYAWGSTLCRCYYKVNGRLWSRFMARGTWLVAKFIVQFHHFH